MKWGSCVSDSVEVSDVEKKLEEARAISTRKRRQRLADEIAQLDDLEVEYEGASSGKKDERTNVEEMPNLGESPPEVTEEGLDGDADSDLTAAAANAVADLRQRNIKLKHQKQLLKLRKMVARWALWIVVVQLFLANLFFGFYLGFNLREPNQAIMVAWLTSTVVEVIGILWVIARNLFPYRDKQKMPGRKGPNGHE